MNGQKVTFVLPYFLPPVSLPACVRSLLPRRYCIQTMRSVALTVVVGVSVLTRIQYTNAFAPCISLHVVPSPLTSPRCNQRPLARKMPSLLQKRLKLHTISLAMTTDSSTSDRYPLVSTTVSSSLASSYAIRIHPIDTNESKDDNVDRHELRWELLSLKNWEEPNQGEGTLALNALRDCAKDDGAETDCVLRCKWKQSSDNIWAINVDEGSNEIPNDLQCVLSRIMVQTAISLVYENNNNEEATLQLTLPLREGKGCQQISLSDFFYKKDHNNGVRQLFFPLSEKYAAMEIVDMVNDQGQVLGSLPRPFVHTHNLLHRGIGMIVSKDESILEKSGKLPEVYVHQRTSTKRIFPSLYDMFVGGVSSRGESAKLTAAREVAEELGLKRALECLEGKGTTENNPLSDELFQCAICTSYNRCIVSMFAYTCNTEAESISWQEEEVAWGDFVPYDVVKVAGRLSINRLIDKGTWPGTVIKFESASEAMTEQTDESEQDYSSWDFVPDGLLVWEAWVRWFADKN